MASVLVASDRFFRLPAPWLLGIWLAAALVVCALVWLVRRRLDAVSLLTAGVLVVAMTVGAYGYYKLFRRAVWRLGRHLPTVALLAPKTGDRLGASVALRAHATDEPGGLGVEAAVRSIEFWLYHPSFAEQHAGNRESKVLLATVPGPTADDMYAASWTCSNPYTPPRDGDHSGGDGTRTYTLPDDGRPYSIQAHGLDDEWRAKPGRPGISERVTVEFQPCAVSSPGAAAGSSLATTPAHAQPSAADTGAEAWRSDWETAEGFALDIDTQGFRFPTSIAFVPRPGSGPKDPLYFVTELRGAIKVVTNDRSVHTFASGFFDLELPYELPDMRAENGLGALCLEPKHGYVFASFAYKDAEDKLHNGIVRFQSKPGTFSTAPSGSVRFADPFVRFPSSRSHQIGHMAVVDDALYVAVGDALQSNAGGNVDTILGKVLRMTLDGKPLPDNPMASGSAPPRARDYVWAYGLRNPFGLVAAGGRLFAAENGPGVDRFVRIMRGRSYGYDGSDWSMGTHALAVFAPSVGPAQAAWLPPGAGVFPKHFTSAFYLTFGGNLIPGPGPTGQRSIVMLPYDLETERVSDSAQPVLRYRGNPLQMPVGAAFGPDGLYVAPLFPVRDGTSAILRLSYDPAHAHPIRLEPDDAPWNLLNTLGCNGCHAHYEGKKSVGPKLDPPGLVARARERMSSPDYARSVREIDALDEEPYTQYRDARARVLAATGKEQVRLWLKYRILEPRFDTTTSNMPTQEISERQAEKLADHFVERGWDVRAAGGDDPSVHAGVRSGASRYRYLALSFVLGLAGGIWVTSRRRS